MAVEGLAAGGDQICMEPAGRRFGEMVARVRKGLGLTQRSALVINTGERFIFDLEGGKPTAQSGKALAAARVVGLRPLDPLNRPETPYGRGA